MEELQVQGDDVDDSLILRVDLINAFNQVDRDAAFKEVEDHFPEMLSWVLTCYKYLSQDLKQMILGRSAEKFLFLSQQICYRDSLQKLNRKKQQQN